MTQAIGTVLRTDVVGRVMTPPERRESLVDEFERSGLSGAQFAKLAGIKYQTFAAWAARRRKQRGTTQTPAQAADSVRWLEAVVTQAKSPASEPNSPVRVHLSAGSWIEVGDLKQVTLAAALIHALESELPPC
jgi:hypothetical protein